MPELWAKTPAIFSSYIINTSITRMGNFDTVMQQQQ